MHLKMWPLAEIAAAIAGCCYVVMAVDLWRRGAPWLGLSWFFYAAANLATIMHFIKAVKRQ